MRAGFELVRAYRSYSDRRHIAPSSSGMPDNLGIIIARNVLRGNAQLPCSTGGTDRLQSRATRTVKIAPDDQHPALTTDTPP